MSFPTYFLIAILVLAVLYVGYIASHALRTYLRYRGQRIITCPETHEPAAVEVDARNAAEQSLENAPDLRLRNCSRWPERAGCPQDCLKQIEADPDGCRVWTIVEKGYAGKTCVYCRQPIDAGAWLPYWLGHKPALLGTSGRSDQWNEVPAQNLPKLFETGEPVCWNCHVAQEFRREHPELVTNRPPH